MKEKEEVFKIRREARKFAREQELKFRNKNKQETVNRKR